MDVNGEHKLAPSCSFVANTRQDLDRPGMARQMDPSDGSRSRCNWRGWLVMALVSVEWALALGPAFNYSIFLLSFQREFNTSTALTGLVGATAHGLIGLGIAPAAGLQQWLALAPRSLAMIGVFLHCGGFFLTSFVPSLWYAFLTYGVAVGLGMSFIVQAGISLCLVWFPTKHSTSANALVAFGVPCATLIFAPILTTLISAYGWRRAFMITSGSIFVIAASAALFLTTPTSETIRPANNQNSPEETRDPNVNEPVTKTHPSAKERSGRHQKPFYRYCDPWLWLIGILFGALGWTFITINLASYMDSIQFTSDYIALAIVILSVGQISGEALIVLFGDFLPFLKLYVVAVSFIACAIASGFLTLVSSLPSMLVLSFAFGMAKGWLFAVLVSSPAEMFSHFGHGTVAVLAQTPYGVGIFIGAPITGGLFDLTGDYTLSLLVLVALFALATGCLLLIPIRRKFWSRRMRSTETIEMHVEVGNNI